MLLMPRMVKIIMEGLIPVSEAAREFLQKKYGDRELYIGLDAAVAVGHPAVISTALILVPITIFLAVILPGNKVLPFADLATIPFCVAFIVGSRKGNIVHSVYNRNNSNGHFIIYGYRFCTSIYTNVGFSSI